MLSIFLETDKYLTKKKRGIRVSPSPRARAGMQGVSAHGHQESSITEERALMRPTRSCVGEEQSSFSSPSRFPTGNIISSPRKIKAP